MRMIFGYDTAFEILQRQARAFFAEGRFAELYSDPDELLSSREMMMHAKSLVGYLTKGVRDAGHSNIADALTAYFLPPVVESLNEIYARVDVNKDDEENQAVLEGAFQGMISLCAVHYADMANAQKFHANENRRPQPQPV